MKDNPSFKEEIVLQHTQLFSFSRLSGSLEQAIILLSLPTGPIGKRVY